MEADNRAWVPREPGTVRAQSVVLVLMDQARAWKHDKDLSNPLTDRAAGLLGHYAILTIIRPRNAGKLPDCGTPARDQVTGLAEAEDAEIATVILIRDHEYPCEDRVTRRVRENPAVPPADLVNLTGEMRAMDSCSRRTDRWRSRSPIT